MLFERVDDADGAGDGRPPGGMKPPGPAEALSLISGYLRGGKLKGQGMTRNLRISFVKLSDVFHKVCQNPSDIDTWSEVPRITIGYKRHVESPQFDASLHVT